MNVDMVARIHVYNDILLYNTRNTHSDPFTSLTSSDVYHPSNPPKPILRFFLGSSGTADGAGLGAARFAGAVPPSCRYLPTPPPTVPLAARVVPTFSPNQFSSVSSL